MSGGGTTLGERLAALAAKWSGCWCGPQMAPDHDPRVQDGPQHGDGAAEHFCGEIVRDLRAILAETSEANPQTEQWAHVLDDMGSADFYDTEQEARQMRDLCGGGVDRVETYPVVPFGPAIDAATEDS